MILSKILLLKFSTEVNKNSSLILLKNHKMVNLSLFCYFLDKKIYPLLASIPAQLASFHPEEFQSFFSLVNE